MKFRIRQARASANANTKPEGERKLTSEKRGLTFQLWVSGFLALVVLLVIVGTTMAWISVNRLTGDNDLEVTSESTGLLVKGYNIYRSLWDETSASYIAYDVTNLPFALNDYDAVFGRNEYSPAYICIHLTGDALQAGKTLNFRLTRENTSPEPNGLATTQNGLFDPSNEVADYLSNIVHQSVALIPALSGETNPQTVYTTANDPQQTWNGDASFASTQADANGKTQTVSKNADSGVASVTLTASGDVDVYLKLDYREDLVMGYINSHRGLNTVLRLDKTLVYEFTGDLTQITIEEAQS